MDIVLTYKSNFGLPRGGLFSRQYNLKRSKYDENHTNRAIDANKCLCQY